MRHIFIFAILLTSLSTEIANACSCKMAYKVPSSAGDVTITKVKVSSVQVTIPGSILLTFPYDTKWRGSRKIKKGKKHTFTFNVISNCTNGTRQFAVTRKDGKTCYKTYQWPHPYDYCGGSGGNTTPVVSCEPNEWRTTSPR